MPSAVIYVRKSNDPHDTRSSVDRQEAYCRELAGAHNLDVARVYVDNDISAASDEVRPDFERMLRQLHGVDVVLAWETERLYRRAGDQERLFRAAERAGATLLTGDGTLDPTRDSDWLTAGLGAVAGGHEVRKVTRRVRDAIRANAAAGRPHGRIPYGWTRQW